MDQLKCIIIDDEEGAHLVLSHYIRAMNTLSLSGMFYDGISALEFIHKEHVDIIFLDINMPGLSGLEMLGTLSERPYTILTTAYKEYALDAYQYEVVDYLVKPFDFKKFLSAIDKIFKRIGKKIPYAEKSKEDYLMIKVDGDFIKIEYFNLLYMQSFGNFVRFFTEVGMYLSQITTNELEEKIDKSKFMRVHKSYIVNLSKISKISGGQIFLRNETILPIGNTYKRELIAYYTKAK